MAVEGKVNYLYRSRPDGSARQKVTPDPIVALHAISPDARWAVIRVAVPGQESAVPLATMAYPLAGGVPVRICTDCAVSWPPDEKSIYIADGKTICRVPLPSGMAFPPLPAGGIQSEADLKKIPGAKLSSNTESVTEYGAVSPGMDPSTYAIVKWTVHRNLYRIPIP
jgi:hypothetical protein